MIWLACPLRSLTGIACPTCGGTRAVLSLLHGDIAGALAWNPFVILGLAVVLGAGATALIAPGTVARRLAHAGAVARTRRGRWLMLGGFAGAIAWQTTHL